MKAIITLTPAESRRLIAKAVVSMPEVRTAFEKAYLILAGGTTNAFLAQELLGNSYEPGVCTVGLSTNGLLCVTAPDSRKGFPSVFFEGKPVDKTIPDALADFHKETVIIKGANAVDPHGVIGIITAGFDGGTIPRIIGPATSKGLKWITPVGLEKLVPSVVDCAKAIGGATTIDISMGADAGMYCLSTTTVVTEIEAIKMLFNCKTELVCCGGIGGNEGAVTLAVTGEEENVKAAVEYLEENIKGEPQVKGNKGVCETCRYKYCRYNGLKGDELPTWMKKLGIER